MAANIDAFLFLLFFLFDRCKDVTFATPQCVNNLPKTSNSMGKVIATKYLKKNRQASGGRCAEPPSTPPQIKWLVTHPETLFHTLFITHCSHEQLSNQNCGKEEKPRICEKDTIKRRKEGTMKENNRRMVNAGGQ